MNVQEKIIRLSRIIEQNEARIADGDSLIETNMRSRDQVPPALWKRIEPELKYFVTDMCELFRETIELRQVRDELRKAIPRRS